MFKAFYVHYVQMNVAQLLHGNIFARSILLQTCLGCYNNSCCYICHCCGSRLAKRATYITSPSNCLSFHIPSYWYLLLSVLVFHSLSGHAYLDRTTLLHSALPDLCEDRQLKYTEIISSRNKSKFLFARPCSAV